MQRVIVTGANGSGKSYLASRLGAARPEIPIVSFDAIKLARNWTQKPRAEIEAALARVVAEDVWILEGGPSLLPQALPRADAVIWLDPMELTRMWRLLTRPWRNFGKARPELPPGNIDWPARQYWFALRSLGNRARFRSAISGQLEAAGGKRVWHCRSQEQVDAAIEGWRRAGG